MFGLVYGYEPRGTLWTVSEGLDFGGKLGVSLDEKPLILVVL